MQRQHRRSYRSWNHTCFFWTFRKLSPVISLKRLSRSSVFWFPHRGREDDIIIITITITTETIQPSATWPQLAADISGASSLPVISLHRSSVSSNQRGLGSSLDVHVLWGPLKQREHQGFPSESSDSPLGCISWNNFSSSSLEPAGTGRTCPTLELVMVDYGWSGAAARHEQHISAHFQLQMASSLTWLQALADDNLQVCRCLWESISEDISHQLQGWIKLWKIIQLCSIISLHCCFAFYQFGPSGIKDHLIFIILLALHLLAWLFLSGIWIITALLLFLLRFFFPSVSFLQVPTESKTHLSSLKLDGSSEHRRRRWRQSTKLLRHASGSCG